jgi:hypothetical protein
LRGPVIKKDDCCPAFWRNGGVVNGWHVKFCTVLGIDGKRHKWSGREKSSDLSEHIGILCHVALKSRR